MTRLLSGAFLLALFGAAAWWAAPAVILAIAAAVAVLAAREYATLSNAVGTRVSGIAIAAAAGAITVAAGLPAVAGLAPVRETALVPVAIAVVLAFAIEAISRGETGRDVLARTASPVFGALYLGLPLGSIASVRATFGRDALALLIVLVVVSDTAQYYVGRALGRRPLSPSLSPKKTIEGAIGGIVFGAAALALIGRWWWPASPLWLRLAAGAGFAVLGICGDLFESMLKRAAGTKDSSHLIPGHGGLLDRIDALLFVAPVYDLVLRYFVRPA